MVHTPSTFVALKHGWRLTALNPQAIPDENVRSACEKGIPADMPNEAMRILLEAGLIPDPFDGANEQKLQWVGDVDWRFTCTFEWHNDGNTRHDLVAYGIDTIASISLNGRFVDKVDDYYRTYRWDVRSQLREGENTLVVDVLSPVRESSRLEQVRGLYPHTEHHAFNQIRKPSSQFGWDWGIDIANAGIWQPIGIDSWSGARIVSVRPLVDVDRHGTGILNADVEVEREGMGVGRNISMNNPQESRVPVTVHVSISSPAKDGQEGRTYEAEQVVEPTRNHAKIQIEVPNAQLWWPRGYGDHPLYTVTVTAQPSDSAQHAITAQWNGHVGFRTVSFTTDADNNGRPFQIFINHVPIHAMGYNWIPDDALITRVGTQRHERAFRDLTESNSNIVRVWGGGLYEDDEFYDLADSNGIMVWQDCALACASYPEDPHTVEDITCEIREQIIRLCSHPSLVVWNGSNEDYIAYAQWGGYKQNLCDKDEPVNAYGFHEKGWGDLYYSHIIPDLLNRLDPTRIYIPSSPMAFTKQTSAGDVGDGTSHIWDIWNDVDYRHYAAYAPRFADEFGYQAPPAWSTLTRVVHDQPISLTGPQMSAHQKAVNGQIKLARGMRGHLTPGATNDISRNADGSRNWLLPTDSWKDPEDWHWACQLQQAQAIRFGVSHFRSIEPINAGSIIWQLNDDWPVISWAAVDYDGHRKPLWYASRQFFANRFATIQREISEENRHDHSWEGMTPLTPDILVLTAVNDTREPWSGTWTIRRVRFDGTELASQTETMSLKAGQSGHIRLNDNVAHATDLTQEVIVATASADPSTNGPAFERTIFDCAEVIDQKLAQPSEAFSATCEPAEGGYLLTVTAKSYVRDLFCMVDKVDAHAQVDQGMISLLPGEKAELHISSSHAGQADQYVAPRVVRSANDLCRN